MKSTFYLPNINSQYIYFFKTFNYKYEQNAYCHKESSVLSLIQPLRGHTLRSIEGHV